MFKKINILAIAVFLILFILIVNAAEDVIGSSNNTSNDLTISSAIEDNSNQFITNETKNDIIIESIKKESKSVTASFGVYLQIVG